MNIIKAIKARNERRKQDEEKAEQELIAALVDVHLTMREYVREVNKDRKQK